MVTDRMMSAEEAADRIANRGRSREPSPGMAEESRSGHKEADGVEAPEYTCENCGGHEFMVIRNSDESQTEEWTLECSCGETDIAAQRQIMRTRTVTEAGRLDSGHRVDWDCDEYEGYNEVEDAGEDDLLLEVNCRHCYEDANPNAWECEVLEDWEADEESEVFEVRCAACEHEVEFGWSHPNRGGRIWPCESTDFNPWRCWPEKRFAEAWARRGWLRPQK